MTCPKCRGALDEAFVNPGVLIDVCSGCHGCWLDKGEVNHFAPRPSELKQHFEAALRAPRPTQFKCPRCAGDLQEITLGQAGLALDHCPRCEGLWFDAKELRVLSKARLGTIDVARARSSPSAAAAAAAGGVAGGVGALVAGAGAPALTFAAPALPNLTLRAVGVLVFLYGMVTLLVITAVEVFEAPLEVSVGIGLGFVLLQYLIGPFWMDLWLRWAQSCRWVDRAELPVHLVAFTERVCADKRIGFPRFGIIEDGSPNAFTYGHHRGNARLVLTRGLMEMLAPEELEGVAAHEMGHIRHLDVVVMTIAGVVPLILYYIYRTLMRLRFSGRNAAQAQLAAKLTAVGAYILYILAQYLVLWLSRTREYHADRFAAEVTRNPNALASALVKIAYGLAGKAQAGQAAQPAAAASGASVAGGGGRGFQAFGIFDSKAAQALTATTSAGGSAFSTENMLNAMQWDLWNPWAGYFEIHSTHPLPARRLLQLSAQAWKMGQKPLVMFDREKPESFWDEFLVDFTVRSLPPLLVVAGFALVLALGEDMGVSGPAGLFGIPLIGYGLGHIVRTWFSYRAPDGHADFQVAGLLKYVKVSPVRGVPCRVRGRIIGRGVPGLIISDDLVLQDETGFIFLDYVQPLRLIEFFFGLFRAGGIIGQEAVVTGFYRRGPMPYVEMLKIERADGVTHNCYVRGFRRVFGVLAVIAGALLLALEFGAI